MKQQELLEERIRAALDSRTRHAFPEGTDLWPRIQASAQRSNAIRQQRGAGYGRWQRLAATVTICLVFLTASVVVAAAASPSVRQLLQEAVPGILAGQTGEEYSQQGIPRIQPLPSFPVYYPSVLPAGLGIHGAGQLNPRYGSDEVGGGYNCPSAPAACPPAITVFLPPHPAVGLPSLLAPFQGTGTDVVWFGSHGIPPDQRFVQIVEWNVTTSSLKELSSQEIPPLQPGDHETLLVLTHGATTIAIDTNLGTTVAQELANSLQPLPAGDRPR